MRRPGKRANINRRRWKRVYPEFLQPAMCGPDPSNVALPPSAKVEWQLPEFIFGWRRRTTHDRTPLPSPQLGYFGETTKGPGMRRMRENRRDLGASSDVPAMRRYVVL